MFRHENRSEHMQMAPNNASTRFPEEVHSGFQALHKKRFLWFSIWKFIQNKLRLCKRTSFSSSQNTVCGCIACLHSERLPKNSFPAVQPWYDFLSAAEPMWNKEKLESANIQKRASKKITGGCGQEYSTVCTAKQQRRLSASRLIVWSMYDWHLVVDGTLCSGRMGGGGGNCQQRGAGRIIQTTPLSAKPPKN